MTQKEPPLCLTTIQKFRVFGSNGNFFWLVHGKRFDIEVEWNINETIVKWDGSYTYIQYK